MEPGKIKEHFTGYLYKALFPAGNSILSSNGVPETYAQQPIGAVPLGESLSYSYGSLGAVYRPRKLTEQFIYVFP